MAGVQRKDREEKPGRINKEKLRKAREAAKRGAGIFKMKVPGEYLLYICPPCRPEDDLPYVESVQHFALRKGLKLGVNCLNLEVNEILTDPRIHEHLDGGEADVDGGCPRCEKYETVENAVVKKEIGRKKNYTMNVVCLGFKAEGSRKWEMKEDLQIEIFRAGPQIWEKITDFILDNEDVTNPEAAIFCKAKRTGTGQNDTRYDATVDVESAKDPYAFDADFVEKLAKALEPGGPNDLYKSIARGTKTRDEIEKIVAGKKEVKTDEDGNEIDEEVDPDAKPESFGLDYSDDDTCKVCPWRVPCAALCEQELFEGHEPGPDDHGYAEWAEANGVVEEEEKPEPVKPKRKPAATPEPVAAKPATKPASAAKPAPAKPAPAATTTRRVVKQPDPEPEEEEETEEEPDEEVEEATSEEPTLDEQLELLGYDEGQIGRMIESHKHKVVDENIPPTAAAVLKSGAVKIFYDRLPEDHELYQEPEEDSEEVEPPPKPAARKPVPAPAPEPAAAPRRGRPPGSKNNPKPAPKPDPEDELPPEPDETKSEDEELDDLERAIAEATKPKKRAQAAK